MIDFEIDGRLIVGILREHLPGLYEHARHFGLGTQVEKLMEELGELGEALGALNPEYLKHVSFRAFQMKVPAECLSQIPESKKALWHVLEESVDVITVLTEIFLLLVDELGERLVADSPTDVEEAVMLEFLHKFLRTEARIRSGYYDAKEGGDECSV